ncbi:hypothetical protein Esti_000002 [Eimeria stiedai]
MKDVHAAGAAVYKAMKREKTESLQDPLNLPREALPFRLLHAAVDLGLDIGALAAARELKLMPALLPTLEEQPAEPAALAAAIAVGAGWPASAERLLRTIGQFDQVALLLESRGEVEKAIEVAAHHSPIILRELQQRLGESLVRSGETKKAINAFLAAATPFKDMVKDDEENESLNANIESIILLRLNNALPLLEVGSSSSVIPGEKSKQERNDLLLEDSSLLHLDAPDDLIKTVVESAKSRKLFTWYAAMLEDRANDKNCETRGEKERQIMLAEAARFYHKGKNWLQFVRLLVNGGNEEEALEICEKEKDEAACVFLATTLFQHGKCGEAIKLLLGCRCVAQAIQLCQMSNNAESESAVVAAALRGAPHEASAAARMCMRRGSHDKAVALFQAAGRWCSAVELCLDQELLPSLRGICRDLIQRPQLYFAYQQPETLIHAAAFLTHKGFAEEAVLLLTSCELTGQAVKLCEATGASVPQLLVDKLARRLQPVSSSADSFGGPMDHSHTHGLIKRVAALLQGQQECNRASALLALAGLREEALESLAAGGDLAAIINFAARARSPKVYQKAAGILAEVVTSEEVFSSKLSALQLSPHEQQHHATTAIEFFAKAKAFEPLCNFAQKAAQVLIHQKEGFVSANKLLRLALEKMKPSLDEVASLRDALVQAKDAYDKYAEVMEADDVATLRKRMQEHKQTLRVLGLEGPLSHMIELLVADGKDEQAASLLQHMQSRHLKPERHLSPSVLLRLKQNAETKGDGF